LRVNTYGCSFAKLEYDLVEKHGFIACRAMVYRATAAVAFWTQPIGTAIGFMAKRSTWSESDAVLR
jgi:hypothetical protein